MRVAIFPGTFDPPHLGHVDTLIQASQVFDKIYWLIAENNAKDPTINLDTRLLMLRKVIARLEIDKKIPWYIVVPQRTRELLVHQCKHDGAKYIVRSLRGSADFDYEFPMSEVNRELAPDITTVYFPPFREHIHISSTLVRELKRLGQDISSYVPEPVVELWR